MWVLYNRDGQVVTSIPHGEIIRQGSSASVYIAFEKDYFHSILGEKSIIYSTEKFIEEVKKSVNVGIKYNQSTIEYNPEPALMQFRKLKDNESTLLLENGKTYLVYKVNLGVESTRYSGEHKLHVEFNFLNKDNKEIIDKVETLGSINIYVEPTYGYNENQDTVEKETAQLILAKLQQMLSNKLSTVDEKVWLLEDTNATGYADFARLCRLERDYLNVDKIFVGLINNTFAIGVVNENSDVTIVASNGVITKVKNDGKKDTITIDNSFKINGKLEVDGDTNINGEVSIDGDTTIDGGLETTGGFSTTHIAANRIAVDKTLNATGASVIVDTQENANDKQATNKGYVNRKVIETAETLEKDLKEQINQVKETLTERINEVFNQLTGGELSEDLNSIFELVEFILSNKEEIEELEKTLDEAITKTKYDDTLEMINQVLEINHDYTFNSNNVKKLSFSIPTTVKQGYMSGFSVKIGEIVPQFNFLNGSKYPMLFTLNGSQRPLNKISLIANQTLLGGVMCDGINVYVYLKEMQNGNIT